MEFKDCVKNNSNSLFIETCDKHAFGIHEYYIKHNGNQKVISEPDSSDRQMWNEIWGSIGYGIEGYSMRTILGDIIELHYHNDTAMGRYFTINEKSWTRS